MRRWLRECVEPEGDRAKNEGSIGWIQGEAWRGHGGTLGKAWGKPWENHGEALGKPWGNPGEALGKPWGAPGNTLEHFGNTRWSTGGATCKPW